MDFYAEFLPNIGAVNLSLLPAKYSSTLGVIIKVSPQGILIKNASNSDQIFCDLKIPVAPRSLRFTKPCNLHIKSPATTGHQAQKERERGRGLQALRATQNGSNSDNESISVKERFEEQASCGFCNQKLLNFGDLGPISVKPLPTEYWAELVECWTCHAESYATIPASEAFSPSPTILLHAPDHIQCHPSISQEQVTAGGQCRVCAFTVGYDQTRLFTASPEAWLGCAMAESQATHNLRRFIIKCKGRKDLVLKLSVINSDTFVQYSSATVSDITNPPRTGAILLPTIAQVSPSTEDTSRWTRVFKLAFLDTLVDGDESDRCRNWTLGENEVLVVSEASWLRITLALRRHQRVLPPSSRWVDLPGVSGKTKVRLSFLPLDKDIKVRDGDLYVHLTDTLC